MTNQVAGPPDHAARAAGRTHMRHRSRTILTAASLAVVSFLVFNANGREIATYDSQPAKLLAIEIVARHTLDLGYVVGQIPALAERPGFVRDVHGTYRTAYPLPSALMASATAWLLSTAKLIDLDGPLSAALVAKLTASSLTALAVAFAFVAAARRAGLERGTLVALGFGLGTNLWASVSQTLWQQETALCALMAAIVLLTPQKSSIVRCLTVGVLVGIAGWARPQLAPTVAVLALSMTARWGWRGLLGWIPLVALATLAISINMKWFGNPLGAVPCIGSPSSFSSWSCRQH